MEMNGNKCVERRVGGKGKGFVYVTRRKCRLGVEPKFSKASFEFLSARMAVGRLLSPSLSLSHRSVRLFCIR